jgi:pyruvate/2-oxoglutarate dehydrogenase complex dihydrolipoamide dehydrogenase (E3) component
MQTDSFDLVIIGAGSAGLVMAAVAAELKFSVALVEGHKMGGDCLNYGCVPSKALLAAAHKAHAAAGLSAFGIRAKPEVDFGAVMAHVRGVIAAIAPHDSEERFRGLGATVVRGHATFADSHTVVADGQRLRGRRIVIATGARAFVPPIKGLAEVPYLTNETLFDLTTLPAHLLVLGGGPIGVEMAQAFRRLGSAVSLVEAAPRILGRDDPDLAAVVRAQLIDDGITLYEGIAVTQADGKAGALRLHLADGTVAQGTHLLVAAGRAPNVEELGLEAAGVTFSNKGIPTDGAMRTNKRHIFAIGDVTGPYQFTHMAGYQAGLVIRRSLFGGVTTKADYRAVPWVTYTQPELAGVGLTEQQARQRYGHKVRVVSVPTGGTDRAQAERDDKGLLKVILHPNGTVLGAGMAGTQAGELIHQWAAFVQLRLPFKRMAEVIHAYPTRAEINRKAVSAFYRDKLYAPLTRRLSHLMFRILG